MVINYVKNENGAKMIWHKGFLYSPNKKNKNGRSTWRCIMYRKNKCKSRVHVLDDEIVFESDNHNHEKQENAFPDICEKGAKEEIEAEDDSFLMPDNDERKTEEGVCEDDEEEEDVKDKMDTGDNDNLTKDEEEEEASNVVQVAKSHESINPQHSYIIKPSLEDKFKAYPIREIVQQTLNATLGGKVYDSENAKQWTIAIANTVNQNIRDLRMKRYKHIVQVTIGELKGAGVKSGLRCLWDSDTDGYTSEIFKNDTIFAVVVVFAVYLY